jgi:hypothetical protein
MSTIPLLKGVTTAVPTYGNTITLPDAKSGPYSIHIRESGTGAVTATVVVYVSNTNVSTDWLTLGTFSLSGTTTVTDGFAFSARWKYIRAGVTAISGTSATINCVLCA